MTRLVRRRMTVGILLLLCWTAANPEVLAQLRIVTYNTATAAPENGVLTARTGMETVLAAIGAENVGGVSKPIDVLLLQEQFSMANSAQSFVDVLNDLYDPVHRTMYARSTVNGLASADFLAPPLTGAGGRPGLVYNTQTVNLIDEVRFGTVGGSQQARQTLRYQLRPVGYDAASDFYVYNDHYKAGTSSSDQNRRFVEAQSVRNNADALGQGTHIIYAGDFNIRSSSETMYGELLSSGHGQAFDPISTSGTWHNNSSLRVTHTQSPASSSHFSGQVLGGVDDRFDFQLNSGEFLDGEGLSYLVGSYHAFGNNGTHSGINSAITTGSGAAPNVLAALTTASDHLPVVADYQVPAILSAQLGTLPTTVPLGAAWNVDVLVENVANVFSSLGADELDYTVSVSGDLLGSAAGTDFALGGFNAHPIALDTSVAGLRSGVVTVSSSSQGAANALVNLPVSYVVGAVNQLPFQVRDDFDTPIGLHSFMQSPAAGAFSSSGDGFERYQVGVSATIPNGLVDESNHGFPTDTLGVIDAATKSDGWFGVIDLENSDHPSGTATATWVFDIAEAMNLEVSIDMAAMGDFEGSSTTGDFFDWTYSIDGGPALALFTSSVDEAGSATYTLADGDNFGLNDPLVITNLAGEQTQLSNTFQTLTSALSAVGETLTLELTARANGGSEAYAIDNLMINGITILAADADFDQDGDVDGHDFLAWQRGFGSGTMLGQGDANGDGFVNEFDLVIWQTQFGKTTAGTLQAAAKVPEPSSLMLMLALLLLHSARSKIRTTCKYRRTFS